jgi:hypothetical protein
MAQVELTVIEQSGVEVTILDAPGAQVAIGPTLSTATPQAVGLTGAAGDSSSAARGNHSHAHGNQTGTSLHALANGSGAGFMSAAQFSLLDGATAAAVVSSLVRRDASGNFAANLIDADLDGNAATATKLATARTINGVSFDGTNNITITAAPTADSVVNASVASNAAIALSKLATGALPTAITVASANLVDGTIVDADINASAAIALTKLAAVTAGRVVMGNASNVATVTEITGDATLASTGVLTLSNSGVSAATVNNAATSVTPLTIDVKGRITGTGSPVTITPSYNSLTDLPTTLAGYGITDAVGSGATAGRVLLGNSSNLVAATEVTGDVTINSSGVTAIGSGVIVNADVNASAAIAGSKIAPDFGAQNVLTTGTITGASLNPTGTTVPAAGLFMPATNVIGCATNTLERWRTSPGGALLVGATAEPLGQVAGTVVANNKIIVGANNHGRFQQHAGIVTSTITASTGTLVFRFKQASSGNQRSALVRLSITQESGNNVAQDHPAAVYMFRLFNTSAGVCGIGGTVSSMEYQYVMATHFAFADLGSGECTVTLTNPRAVGLTATHYAVVIVGGGLWFLDTVTST